ncbi:hypothetical protein P691DRAFT_758725 [Macrolepiota fuliginosa MF-IS2]|uniref:F-box domain-containing protein n=1 Tax=Macrolepiota fuliginosa MF-IS2 TaxID=1400762 RepID=A0A9P6C638_9AGAR|nr:hypothetical protein P691DRAFT_758725 [Macrolepiota fuliginosa MF-IS2]
MPIKMSCPSCGHAFDANHDLDTRASQTDSGPIFWPQEVSVAPFQEEVHYLDEVIYRLNGERAKLLRRINSVKASTRHLPSEVLSTIFQFARPPIDFQTRSVPVDWTDRFERADREVVYEDDFQLDLGAVSHYWRAVAWSTPQLWTTLSIQINGETIENNTSLLKLYFQNARGLPMTIDLDCRIPFAVLEDADPIVRAGLVSTLKPIGVLLFSNNAHKIRELIVTDLLPEWLPFIGGGLSGCEAMELWWRSGATEDWNNVQLPLAELPCLRRLRMNDLIHYTPSQTLTALELHDMPTRVFVKILMECRNLVKYKVDYSRPGAMEVENMDTHTGPVLNKTFVNENLEYLQWYDASPKNMSGQAFLVFFRFTRLQVLRWSRNPMTTSPRHDDPETTLMLHCFFSELPPTLHTLTLAHSFSFLALKTIFSALPRVESFCLEAASQSTTADALAMIGHLTEGLSCGTSPGSPVIDHSITEGTRVLVALKSLSIDTGFLDTLVARTVRMLEMLYAARTVAGPFLLKFRDPIPWSRNAVNRLKALIAQGFELVIMMGTETLDLMTVPTYEDVHDYILGVPSVAFF